MAPPVACVMCMLTIDNTTLIVPVAQATVITIPFLFRHHIVDVVRRRRGRIRPDETSSADGDERDRDEHHPPEAHFD
jgi:hypothetical protein